MAKNCKVHAYSIIPEGGCAEDIDGLLRAFANRKKLIRFKSNDGDYAIDDAHNRRAGGKPAFTATIFKLRSTELPSVIDGDGVKRLPLAEDTHLGEPICFAYDPSRQVAVVQSSASGPRAQVISHFLDELRFPYHVEVEPLLRRDMIERLEKTSVFRSLEFKIRRPARQARAALGNAGLPIERALEAMEDVDAATIGMQLSIGNGKGELMADKVKSYVKRLFMMGSTDVTSLKVSGVEKEGSKAVILDMLGARVEYLVELKASGREWDRDHCQRQLAGFLQEVDPEARENDDR